MPKPLLQYKRVPKQVWDKLWQGTMKLAIQLSTKLQHPITNCFQKKSTKI